MLGHHSHSASAVVHIYYGLFQRRPQGLCRRHCSDEFSLVIHLSFRIRIPNPRPLHYDGALSHGHTPNCSVARICKFIPFLSRLSARPTDAFYVQLKLRWFVQQTDGLAVTKSPSYMIEHANLVGRHIGLCYFAIFTHDPVPGDSNKLCVIPHTATTRTSVVSVVGFQPAKNLSRRWELLCR